MGPVSGTAVAKSATIAATGSSLTILGNMAGLTGADWALVIFCVFGSVFGGSYALQGEVDAKHGHDSPEAVKARKLAVSMFAAQFALGMAAAAQLTGSQRKAAAAQEAGKFKDEIVDVLIPQRKGDALVFNTDEFINKKTSEEVLAGLRPAFDKAGSVTAGNASGINDGAAAVMVMSAKKAAALGLKPLARIAAFGTSGLDPATMGMGPVPASQKALARAGWKAQDVDLFELNEAFAAQACAVNQALDIDPAKVNVNGGAIAIGHPIGASGCRILVTLLHEMQRRQANKGLAALCIGGGMGVSLAVERV